MGKGQGRNRKLSEVVAEQMLEEIKARGWPAGESIGNEAELIEKYGVSRATLVEATRQVESHGAAVMRRGSGGGLFVQGSAISASSRLLSTFLELSDVSIGEIYEAARILETESARQAARFADEDAVSRLRKLAEELSQTSDRVELHRKAMQLRFAIAETTGSRALTLMMRALARVITSYVRPDLNRGLRDRRFEHQVAADMLAIVESIVARDQWLADNHTRRDVDRREERARLMAVRQADLSGGPLLKESPSKLAEQTALAVRNDIAANGWRVGERVANESELPDRYGVSQWTIRQAIRMLELHGVVVARRGQGGGLFVGSPDPTFALESAVQFLDGDTLLSQSAPLVHRRIFESLVQIGTLRASSAQRDALVELASSSKPALQPFLEQIVAMSGNRVLALFAGISGKLISYEHSLDPAGLNSVAQAVAKFDAAYARRLLGDYLYDNGPENTLRNSAA